MLTVISPAKSLNAARLLPSEITPSLPREQARAYTLVKQLRGLTSSDISALMSISDDLAKLNHARFASFKAKADTSAARAAVLLFDGDVYDGLQASTLTSAQLNTAQDSLRILSGLYGVLRPLDLMQAYRLEMGTRLANEAGKDLYAYWGEHITERLNQDMKAGGHSELINLASEEYFKSVKPKKLAASIVNVQFLDEKNGQYKVISFFAKRARGSMLRWILDEAPSQSGALKGFSREGYRFDSLVSKPNELVFRRSEADLLRHQATLAQRA